MPQLPDVPALTRQRGRKFGPGPGPGPIWSRAGPNLVGVLTKMLLILATFRNRFSNFEKCLLMFRTVFQTLKIMFLRLGGIWIFPAWNSETQLRSGGYTDCHLITQCHIPLQRQIILKNSEFRNWYDRDLIGFVMVWIHLLWIYIDLKWIDQTFIDCSVFAKH